MKKPLLTYTALAAFALVAATGCATSPVEKLASDMVQIPGRSYRLCKYEVTQALWESVMGSNPSGAKGPDRPVENIRYETCLAFIAKLNETPAVKASGRTYRLPSVEEWEFACRAGGKGAFGRLKGGAEGTLDAMGWYGGNSGYKTHPVGEKKPNAFGLFDMHGNVREFTSTPGERDPTTFVLVCGGGHADYSMFCHCDSATPCAKDLKGGALGFRLAN